MALGFALLMNLGAYWFSDKIVLAMAASLLRSSFGRLTVRMFYAHRASRRIVFAEIVGGRPRARVQFAPPVLLRFAKQNEACGAH